MEVVVKANKRVVETKDGELLLDGQRPAQHLWHWTLREVQGGEGFDKLEEWFYKHAPTSCVLGYWDVSPDVTRGRITALTRCDGKEDRELTAEEYKLLGFGPDDEDYGCVEEHPEGSDRGGYVPTLNDGSYYDENAGEWL